MGVVASGAPTFELPGQEEAAGRGRYVSRGPPKAQALGSHRRRAAREAQLGCQTQSYGEIGLGLHMAQGGGAQGQGLAFPSPVASGLTLEGSVEKRWEREMPLHLRLYLILTPSAGQRGMVSMHR